MGLTSLDMDGNVNVAAVTGGTAGGDWGVEIELTGLTGVVEDGDLDTVAGAYSGTFYIGVNGEDELIVTLSGTRANGSGTLDAYSLSLGDQTVIGSVTRTVDGNGNIIDTTTLADEQESVTLTLTVLLPATGSTSATGVFSSLGIQTGTMDETGHILFIDDTVQNLNASIFATPSDD